MRHIIRFLNNSCLLVAIGAACTCAHAYLICDFAIPSMEVALVFFLTWSAYQFLKPAVSNFRKMRRLTAVTGVAVCWLFVDFRFLFLSLAALPLVLFYDSKWLQEIKNDKAIFALRNNGWLKIVATALAWVIITTCPLFLEGTLNGWSEHSQMLYSNFLLLLALVLAGDIRDMEIDKGVIKSIPVKLGAKTSRIICAALIVLSTVIGAFAAIHYSAAMCYSFIVVQVFSLICLWPFSPKRDWHFQAFVLDGILVLRFMVAFVAAIQSDPPPTP